MPTYGSLVTSAGDALIAAALSGGDPVELATIVIGDANGADVLPAASQTALVHQVYQVSIASLSVDSENPNQILATAVIPAEIGGWDIRELGVKTLDGTLFAVANFSPARKPVAAEGSVWVMEITVAIAIASTSAVTLVVDPDIDYATKQWVMDNFEPLGAGGSWVPITRNLTAGAGLVGGGNLTQDRAFAVDTAWMNMRYSQVGHLHDERYALTGHSHPVAIASGAAGYMSGADKAKLDGLGAAGMRLLAEVSATGINYVSMTLPGPWRGLLWELEYGPLAVMRPGGTIGNDATYANVSLIGRMQDTNSGWPSPTASDFNSMLASTDWRLLRRLNTSLVNSLDQHDSPFSYAADPVPGKYRGTAQFFASGAGAGYMASGYTYYQFPTTTPPDLGQNRYVRLHLVAQPASPGSQVAITPNGAITARVWGF